MQGIGIRGRISYKGDGILDLLPPNLLMSPGHMIAIRERHLLMDQNFKIESP